MKVGDKVRVMSSPDAECVVGEIGEIVVIQDVDSKQNYGVKFNFTRYNLNTLKGSVSQNEGLWLRESEINLVKSNKYSLIVTDKKVIILDKVDNKKGVAICHEDDEFDINVGFKLAWDRMNGIEEIKKLEEPPFKKGKFISNRAWSKEWCDKVMDLYGLSYEFNYGEVKNGSIVNIISKGHIDNSDFYIFNYNNKYYISGDIDFEEYTPKLYDSFGEELKEGDKITLLSDTNVYRNTYSIKYNEDYELFTDGIAGAHNSKINDGKPINGWKVIKINIK